jgi:hypothetical protein
VQVILHHALITESLTEDKNTSHIVEDTNVADTNTANNSEHDSISVCTEDILFQDWESLGENWIVQGMVSCTVWLVGLCYYFAHRKSTWRWNYGRRSSGIKTVSG